MDEDNILHVKPWGKDQGDYVRINKEDFDPEFHELLDAAQKKEPEDDEAKRIEALKQALTEKGIKFRKNATEANLQELLDAAQ